MVQSANMDGTEVKNIVEGIPGAGIAVDIKGNKIYSVSYTHLTLPTIYSV